MNFHVAGTLTKQYPAPENMPLNDNDLSIFRRIINLFSRDTHTILLLGTHHADYSKELSTLLHKTGNKTIVLSLTFNKPTQKDEVNGLLQYLEGSSESPTILHSPSFDTISSGGLSRFGNELIASQKFKSLLKSLSEQYDWIIATTEAAPNSTEGETLAILFDNICVNIHAESIEEIQKLEAALQAHENKKITFIFINSCGKYAEH